MIIPYSYIFCKKGKNNKARGDTIMNLSSNEYKKYAKKKATSSPVFKDCCKAFLFGGLICVIAQGFFTLYTSLGISEEDAKSWVPSTIVFITAWLTGFGVFDKIAKHAGAGTLVPISGFENSVVAEAIDAKNEGWVLGLGAKVFRIAGPVILYGTASGVIYGIIYFIWKTVTGG